MKYSEEAVEAINELQQCLIKWNSETKISFGKSLGQDEERVCSLEALCQKGADLNYLENDRGFSCIPKVYWSIRLIRYFIDRGLDINSRDDEGNTALHLAIQAASNYDKKINPNEDDNIIIFLLKRGADPNATNMRGETPLFVFARARGKFLTVIRSETACLIFEMMLERGADVKTRNNDGECVLHLHSCSYFISAAQFIKHFENDIDVRTARRLYHQTPLMLAARAEDNLETCKMLIARGAQVNATDLQGYTPLHHAVLRGVKKCPELLVDAGADLNAESASGKGVYELAIKRDRKIGPSINSGAEPAKKVEILELAGAVSITKNLDKNKASWAWDQAMKVCRKFELQPSREFLTNYEFLKTNQNGGIEQILYLSAMQTIVRLSSPETKFWYLLWFAPTFKYTDNAHYVFDLLDFVSGDLTRVRDFASIEEVDLDTLDDFSRYFNKWLTMLIERDTRQEFHRSNRVSHFNSIIELTIACLENLIRDTDTNEINYNIQTLYILSCQNLTLVRSRFSDVIPESAVIVTERLLKELINLDLRDPDGNSLMHFIVRDVGIFNTFINSLLSDSAVSNEIVTTRNKAGFELVQTIDWENEMKSLIEKDDQLCLEVMLKMADRGAHVDARNSRGAPTLREKLMDMNKDLVFPYDSLQCACARVLARSLLPYNKMVPKKMVDFIHMHYYNPGVSQQKKGGRGPCILL